jgi:hypothetical protein
MTFALRPSAYKLEKEGLPIYCPYCNKEAYGNISLGQYLKQKGDKQYEQNKSERTHTRRI